MTMFCWSTRKHIKPNTLNTHTILLHGEYGEKIFCFISRVDLMSGKLGLSTRKINWHFRTRESQNNLDPHFCHTVRSNGGQLGSIATKMMVSVLIFRVEPFGLNELWILHIFNTLGTDAEFSNTWKRPNPRPNSKLTLLNFHYRYLN